MSTLEVKGIQAPSGYDLVMPAGNIIQVVSLNKTNAANGGYFLQSTSASFAASALTLAITPTSSSSKIFVQINTLIYSENGPSGFTIFRDSTNLGGSTNGFGRTDLLASWKPLSIHCLDSPNTTSAVTYKFGGKVVNGSSNHTIYVGADSDTVNTITLMEVAG